MTSLQSDIENSNLCISQGKKTLKIREDCASLLKLKLHIGSAMLCLQIISWKDTLIFIAP